MKKIYRSFRISKRDYSRTTGSTRYPRQTPAAEPEPNNTAPPVAPDNKPKTTSGDDTQPGQNQNNPAAVSKPPEWEKDEELVRGSHCLFRVKYLGAKEIFDSRGVDLCDEAFSSLMGRYKQYKRSENGLSSVIHSKLFKSTKNQTDASQTPARNALFYVSSDGLRVVDETRKSLIVDQTIEKVSFCAPVRVDKRGFAYIARDGATKRWMCHVLLAKNVDVSIQGLPLLVALFAKLRLRNRNLGLLYRFEFCPGSKDVKISLSLPDIYSALNAKAKRRVTT